MKALKKDFWCPVCCELAVLALIICSFWMHIAVLDGVLAGNYEHYLWNYALQLLTAAAAVIGAVVLYRLLGRTPAVRKRVTVLFGILLLLHNLCTCVDLLELYDPDMTVYYRSADGEAETFSRREAVWELYGKCHFVRPAEDLFEYPAPEELDPQQAHLRPYAIAEQNRMAALFSGWPEDLLFLRVSLRYGCGALAPYLLSALLWMACAVLGWPKVRRGWRLLYASCVIPVSLLLLGPVLDGFGIVRYPLFLFDEIPCTASWNALFLGGLVQMALPGWILFRQEEPMEAESGLLTRLLLCDKILMGELTAADITDRESATCPLPDGIREDVPFDGSLMEDWGFEPNRKYQIGPVIRQDVRPVIQYPMDLAEASCFEDRLFTRFFVDENLERMDETFFGGDGFDPASYGYSSEMT